MCQRPYVEIHHIVPQAEGGEDTEENAAPLCPWCHEMYGNDSTKRKYIRQARDAWYERCEKGNKVNPNKIDMEWFQLRNLDAAIKAWQQVTFQDVCHVLTAYYEDRGVPLFSYPQMAGKPSKVPLYVLPEWTDLTHRKLRMEYNPEPEPRYYKPSPSQQDFLALYQELRRQLGQEALWNGMIFRLTNLRSSPSELHLSFEDGYFYDSLMCHYILEYELLSRLVNSDISRDVPLNLRDKAAGCAQAIESFCQHYVSRIGISNLILLRSGEDTYVPVIQKRGSLSLAHGFDTVSSGIFDITTTPKADFNLRHKVLKEVSEELFDNVDVAKETRKWRDPCFFYKSDGISDLLELFDSNLATFQVTGFCIDLIRIVPEITTVLVIRDASYCNRHLNGEAAHFRLNLEYRSTSDFNIPRDIEDVDEYLRNDMPTDPDSSKPTQGFDPTRWTLPGAFCFYQGLRRAVTAGLLQ